MKVFSGLVLALALALFGLLITTSVLAQTSGQQDGSETAAGSDQDTQSGSEEGSGDEEEEEPDCD
jgi:hypothetical protein